MKIKTVVFDLYGVLFFLKSFQILKRLGLGRTLRFYLRHGKTPYDYYYLILDKMRKEVPGEFQDEVAFTGNYLPKSLCEWQRGILSCDGLLQRVNQFLDSLRSQNFFAHSWEYELFDTAFTAAYKIENRVPTMYLNKKLVKTIEYLKKEGFSLCMLTNVDYELFDMLKLQFPDVFNLFDTCITSCHTHLLKPQKEIFEYLLQKKSLDPSECFFIDDQQENIDAAQQVGIRGMVYTKKSDVLNSLKNCR